MLGGFQQTSIGHVLIGQPLDNCNTRFGATSPVHYGYSHVLNATARMAERLLEFAIRPRSPSQRFGDSTAIADVGAFASSRTRYVPLPQRPVWSTLSYYPLLCRRRLLSRWEPALSPRRRVGS